MTPTSNAIVQMQRIKWMLAYVQKRIIDKNEPMTPEQVDAVKRAYTEIKALYENTKPENTL